MPVICYFQLLQHKDLLILCLNWWISFTVLWWVHYFHESIKVLVEALIRIQSTYFPLHFVWDLKLFEHNFAFLKCNIHFFSNIFTTSTWPLTFTDFCFIKASGSCSLKSQVCLRGQEYMAIKAQILSFDKK